MVAKLKYKNKYTHTSYFSFFIKIPGAVAVARVGNICQKGLSEVSLHGEHCPLNQS